MGAYSIFCYNECEFHGVILYGGLYCNMYPFDVADLVELVNLILA